MMKRKQLDTPGLPSAFTEEGIRRENFSAMAKKACKGGTVGGSKPLGRQDIETIIEMCL